MRGFESRNRDWEPKTRIFVYKAEALARSIIREDIWADNQTIEIDKKEGAVKLVFTTSQWIPVLRWMLSFGENARPLEPDWFVEEWKTNIIKMFDFIKY